MIKKVVLDLFQTGTVEVSVFIFCFTIMFYNYKNNFFYHQKNIVTSIFTGRVFILISCVLTCLFCLARIQNGHNWGGDFSAYIAQARAILNDEIPQYLSDNEFIITNSFNGLGPLNYPWGFPLLIAPIVKLFGINYIVLKIFGAICYVLSIYFIAKLFFCKLDKKYAFIGTMFFVTSNGFLYIIDSVLSDIPYFLFSVISLYSIDKLYTVSKQKYMYAVLAGISCFFAYFIRAQGIVSIATFFVMDIILFWVHKINFYKNKLNRFVFTKENIASHLIVYLIFFVLFVVTSFIFPPKGISAYNSIFDYFSLKTIYINFFYYLNTFNDFFSMPHIAFRFVAKTFIFTGLLYGMKKSFFDNLHFIIFIAMLSFVVLIFPPHQGIRYIYALIPLVILISLQGLQIFFENYFTNSEIYFITKICNYSVLSAIIIVGFTSCLLTSLQTIRHNGASNTSHNSFAVEVYDFIKNNTNTDEKIFFFKPRVLYLNTGRLSLNENDKMYKTTYYLFLKSDKENLSKLNNKMPIFENEEFIMYFAN